jgi:hypothetical protein
MRCDPVNSPRHYSYNPSLRLVAVTVGAGLAWLTLIRLSCGCWPRGFSRWIGIVSILVGLLLTARRLLFRCYLVLDKDALGLPTGFGRARTKRIPYASIERVWEARLPSTVVLCVATKDGKFEVMSGMLPDAGSYVDIAKFLYAQVNQPKA